ncbi:MAG: hypothetical protein WCO56_11965, partial [Verrucomicrobiota bacterium]
TTKNKTKKHLHNYIYKTSPSVLEIVSSVSEYLSGVLEAPSGVMAVLAKVISVSPRDAMLAREHAAVVGKAKARHGLGSRGRESALICSGSVSAGATADGAKTERCADSRRRHGDGKQARPYGESRQSRTMATSREGL